MAKNDYTSRFITVHTLDDGRKWQYRVPAYVGKVKVGDIVVVGDICLHEVGLGRVVSIDPCALHREVNIWPIVGKVKVKRWERFVSKQAERRQLLQDMQRREAELDALARFGKHAKHDKKMKRLLARYGKLS